MDRTRTLSSGSSAWPELRVALPSPSVCLGGTLAEGVEQAVAVGQRELSWLAQALSACPWLDGALPTRLHRSPGGRGLGRGRLRIGLVPGAPRGMLHPASAPRHRPSGTNYFCSFGVCKCLCPLPRSYSVTSVGFLFPRQDRPSPSQLPVPQGLGHWPPSTSGEGPGAWVWVQGKGHSAGEARECEDGLTPLSFGSFLSSFLPACSHQHANTMYLIFKEILSKTLALPATPAQPCRCHNHTPPKSGRPWLLLPPPLPFPLHPPPCLVSAPPHPLVRKSLNSASWPRFSSVCSLNSAGPGPMCSPLWVSSHGALLVFFLQVPFHSGSNARDPGLGPKLLSPVGPLL